MLPTRYTLALLSVAIVMTACVGPGASRYTTYENEKDNPLVHPPTSVEGTPAPQR